jgi:hypothetical protein
VVYKPSIFEEFNILEAEDFGSSFLLLLNLEFLWRVASPLITFVGQAVAGGGQMSSGGIQFSKGRGDFPVVSPADNEVVIVGEASVVGRLFRGDDWQTTWSC